MDNLFWGKCACFLALARVMFEQNSTSAILKLFLAAIVPMGMVRAIKINNKGFYVASLTADFNHDFYHGINDGGL